MRSFSQYLATHDVAGADTRRALLLSVAGLALIAGPARAQQAAEAVQLPAVSVVQGATLGAKRSPVRAASESGDDASAPPPTPKVARPKPVAAEVKSQKKPKVAKTPVDAVPAPDGNAGTVAGTGAAVDEQAEVGASGALTADKLGTATSVVTRREIEQGQLRTVGDALRALPGIAVSQQGGVGTLTSVRVRGGETRHTLVLIDGVEVNSATDGLVDFANLSTDDVERIEVLRGPQSGIYGTNALSGVVNIVTKSGRGPLTLRLSGEAGSHNTQAGSLQVSGGTDRAWGSATLSSRRTDGFNIAPVGDEREGSRLETLTLTGGVKVTDGLVVDGTWRQSRLFSDRDGFDGWLDHFQVANDNASTSRRDISLGRLAATLELLDRRLVSTAYVSRAENDYHDDDRGFFATLTHTVDRVTTYGATSTYRLDGPQGLPVRHFFTGLVEKRDETFSQSEPLTTDKERGRTSFAGEIRGEYFRDLDLAASVRRDDNDDADDYTTWHAQGSYRVPGTVLRLHASGGTGVKYATFSDLYGIYNRYTPNPLLKPEASLGWDAGVEATLFGGRSVVDVTYFSSELRDAFQADFSNWPTITTVNLSGVSRREGVEVSLRHRLTDSIVTTAAYTFTDARDDKGVELLRRPRHTAKAGVVWSFDGGRGQIGTSVAYNGTVLDLAFKDDFSSTRIALDDYWLVNLTASYKLTPQMELFGRVENALDQHYQDIFGYNATSGVTAYGGVRFTFEDRATADWRRYRE